MQKRLLDPEFDAKMEVSIKVNKSFVPNVFPKEGVLGGKHTQIETDYNVAFVPDDYFSFAVGTPCTAAEYRGEGRKPDEWEVGAAGLPVSRSSFSSGLIPARPAMDNYMDPSMPRDGKLDEWERGAAGQPVSRSSFSSRAFKHIVCLPFCILRRRSLGRGRAFVRRGSPRGRCGATPVGNVASRLSACDL